MNNLTSNYIVTISNNQLTIINNGETKMVNFPSEIRQIEQFENVIVVRIYPKTPSFFLNENVFGVSYEGKILWQIEKLRYVYKDSPFTGMGRQGNYIKLCNWDGTDLIVNPITGEIIEKGYSK